MTDPAVAQILAYLREHTGTYPPEQLREQLLAAGYRPADVDAAFALLSGGSPAQQERLPATAATIALAPAEQPAEQPPDQLRRALAYIEQNRDTYTEDALRDALVRSGYPSALVDEALSRAGVRQVAARPVTWPFGLLVAALNYGLIALVGFTEIVSTDNLIFSLFFAPALVLIELVAGLILRNGPRERLGRALFYGALFSLAGVLVGGALITLFVGVCIALIYSS